MSLSAHLCVPNTGKVVKEPSTGRCSIGVGQAAGVGKSVFGLVTHKQRHYSSGDCVRIPLILSHAFARPETRQNIPVSLRRAAATAVMWSLVAPGGALVLVEDGSAKGSHTVRSARHMVLRPSAPSPEQGD